MVAYQHIEVTGTQLACTQCGTFVAWGRQPEHDQMHADLAKAAAAAAALERGANAAARRGVHNLPVPGEPGSPSLSR